MEIPFLDLKAQYKTLKDEINPAIQKILDNTSYVLGESVKNFELEFAEQHGVKHCVALSSGTAGNHVALWSQGIGPGDEVIIPANTFIATAWGATLCGAKPVFVDCHPESYNIDIDKIEDAITEKTKAIVAVHLYGQPADMEPLADLTRSRNLLLIEDAAQAHLAEYKGRKVGGFGKAASFSFYPGKNLGAYGEAGALVTDDPETAQKARMLRDHGMLQKYYHETFGHNYRMEGIQGAVLGVKLKYLPKWNESRRSVAGLYNKYLADVEQIKLPREMPDLKHVYHLYVIQIADKRYSRDALAAYLKENGVSVGMHYPVPLHLQKCFDFLGYKKNDFPVTEKLAETGLSLPMYPELTETQVEFIASQIKNFFMKSEK